MGGYTTSVRRKAFSGRWYESKGAEDHCGRLEALK